MEKQDIIDGSKIIAQYMGLVYIPFNDLQGLKKPGWYDFKLLEPNIEEVNVSRYEVGKEEKITQEKLKIDINLLKYNPKNDWVKTEKGYYKYICRNHTELRYWNSLDALSPVIQKIENNSPVRFMLSNNGCNLLSGGKVDDRDVSCYIYPNWSNNIFAVITEFLKNERA